jgi:glycosyltransferase involved in cell wall biosynthesis
MRQADPPPLDPALGHRQARVAIFIPSFGDGGVERMLVNLARGLDGLGVQVDFLLGDSEGAPYLETLPGTVECLQMPAEQEQRQRAFLTAYLTRRRPDVVLSAKLKADAVAIGAKRLHPGPTRFFLRPGTTFSARFEARTRRLLRRWSYYRRLRRIYRQADGIVAVSQGVARDVAHIARLPETAIHVVRNPTITPELEDLARQPAEHPWLRPGGPPTIVGMGGLRRQKDFPTLLRAFARLRRDLAPGRDWRLVICGEGRKRRDLQALAGSLGIAEAVSLPGFVANPYALLARARLFVLCSRWEGSPNVLTEALALGTPAVSTDCPSGPREILQGGRIGPLVPVGDVHALAGAMAETLRQPPQADVLREAVSEYRMEVSAARYLRAFDLHAPTA